MYKSIADVVIVDKACFSVEHKQHSWYIRNVQIYGLRDNTPDFTFEKTIRVKALLFGVGWMAMAFCWGHICWW